MTSVFTSDQRRLFDKQGFVIVPGLFDSQETSLLTQAMETDPTVQSHFYERGDADGAVTRMVTWNHPGDSVYGLAARSEKMVDTMEDVLGGEVYHYHSKLTAKEPHEGGAWEWHQDYGYWYHNGCLFPLMASAMIALDASTKDNGCLQVLAGSHHLGRIDHGLLDGDQVGADLNRVTQAQQVLDHVYVELQPGDVLFFHCNLLHRSDQNRSDKRRWTMICCYNAARNNPYREHHHPQYTPLRKASNNAIKEAGLAFSSGDHSNSFLAQSAAPAELTKKGNKLFRS